jgi:hypothetical protein
MVICITKVIGVFSDRKSRLTKNCQPITIKELVRTWGAGVKPLAGDAAPNTPTLTKSSN